MSARAEKAAGAQGIDESTRLRLYQLMVELRLFEKRAYDLFVENLIRGTSHLALGQEAIAAIACLAAFNGLTIADADRIADVLHLSPAEVTAACIAAD